MSTRCILRQAALASVLLLAPLLAHASESTRLHALFRANWAWQLQQFPATASALGEHRFDDRLTDFSDPALAARRAHLYASDKALKAIARTRLNAEDRLSYDLYRYDLDNDLAMDALHGDDGVGENWTLIGHLDGVHIAFSQMLAATRFTTADDYRNYLARLRQVPALLKRASALARRAQDHGWSLPRVTVQRVPEQIERLLGHALEEFSWFAPFVRIHPDVPPETARALADEARQLLSAEVIPALRQFADCVRNDYIPRARSDIAARGLPNGEAYYRQVVRQMTTTDLTPGQIHQIGLDEVARISQAMEKIARAEGFSGSTGDFIRAVRARPEQYYGSADELLAGYGALGKRVDPLVTGLFKQTPRLPWGVRAAPPEERGNSAYYLAGADDGSRAGYFVVDASAWKTSPKFEMTALLLHEAVPGHHLQIASATELRHLPDFRRHTWYVAYGEGWALYAESLGEAMGLYEDRLALLGRYTFEIWRAARLVVDTGIHALGWSRQQAIDYLHNASGANLEEVTSEIDRYIAWPGQALGYKIGELTLQRLRKEAKQALGARFDLRAFHQLVLAAGPLPLALLEQRVKSWIARGGR